MIRKILGININFCNYQQLLVEITDNEIKTITCVNQYYLYLVSSNVSLKNKINSFDIVHPDGIGMLLANYLLFGFNENIKKINGTDLYYKIFYLLNKGKKTIFLLGDKSDILEKTKIKIMNKYPNIIIAGAIHGYQDMNKKNIIDEINISKTDYLFVGLGAPRQEIWINEWKDKLEVNKIIAVGGAFRVIAGDRKRGPKFIQFLGLEWITRLVSEPRNVWRRYLIGIPVFVFHIFKQRMLNEYK